MTRARRACRLWLRRQPLSSSLVARRYRRNWSPVSQCGWANVAETLTTITPDETVRLVTVGQPQALGLDRLINQLDRNTSTVS